MFYEVLINHCKPGSIESWSISEPMETYSKVVSKFKKEIGSPFCFIYVRKCFEDKQNSCSSNFRLITGSSYTFAHFPKVDDLTNEYLEIIYQNLKRDFIDYLKHISFQDIREACNEN